MKKWKSICFVMVLLIIALTIFYIPRTEGQSNTIESIELANLKIINALKAVNQAEENSADVSWLVIKLDAASFLLDEAKVSFKSGNISDADAKAVESSSISSNVESKALELSALAYQNAELAFRQLVTYTVALSFIILIGLFSLWRLFLKRYKLRVLDSKPEVVVDES